MSSFEAKEEVSQAPAPLLPCPFCGGNAGTMFSALGRCQTTCTECHAGTPVAFENKQLSEAAWNRRIGWQPIETAPKDGTRVLLWTDTKADPEDSEYLRSTGGEDFALAQIGQWEVDEWDCLLVGKATHWMPLPEPPK